MSVRTRAPWWVALLALVAGGAAALAPSPAAAEDCDGVWVVVDARGTGGPLTTRCAPGDPGSGLAALEAAGHAYTFVPRVPGMVCTIDARPDPCNGAPPDAYWSYWHAEAGGEWTYASRGAGERDPAPGSVEGWAFGAGATPGASPPSPPASEAPSQDSSGGDGDARGGGGEGSSDAGSSGTGSEGTTGSSGSNGADGAEGPSRSDGSGDTATSPEVQRDATDDPEPPDDGDVDEQAEADDAEGDDAGEGDERVHRRGLGADADDVIAGREMARDRDAGDEDADDGDEPQADGDDAHGPVDEVALGEPSRGGWAGAAAGTALAGALAGAAVWQVRRRRTEPW